MKKLINYGYPALVWTCAALFWVGGLSTVLVAALVLWGFSDIALTIRHNMHMREIEELAPLSEEAQDG